SPPANSFPKVQRFVFCHSLQFLGTGLDLCHCGLGGFTKSTSMWQFLKIMSDLSSHTLSPCRPRPFVNVAQHLPAMAKRESNPLAVVGPVGRRGGRHAFECLARASVTPRDGFLRSASGEDADGPYGAAGVLE